MDPFEDKYSIINILDIMLQETKPQTNDKINELLSKYVLLDEDERKYIFNLQHNCEN